jgi:hypothetical protein
MAADGQTWSAPADASKTGPWISSTGMRAAGSSQAGPEWLTNGSGRPSSSQAGPAAGQLPATTFPGTVTRTPHTRLPK